MGSHALRVSPKKDPREAFCTKLRNAKLGLDQGSARNRRGEQRVFRLVEGKLEGKNVWVCGIQSDDAPGAPTDSQISHFLNEIEADGPYPDKGECPSAPAEDATSLSLSSIRSSSSGWIEQRFGSSGQNQPLTAPQLNVGIEAVEAEVNQPSPPTGQNRGPVAVQEPAQEQPGPSLAYTPSPVELSDQRKLIGILYKDFLINHCKIEPKLNFIDESEASLRIDQSDWQRLLKIEEMIVTLNQCEGIRTPREAYNLLFKALKEWEDSGRRFD
ncbi:hypothetical protein Droror1_Dr00028256 [Drosera rotundifolia]